MRLLTLLTVDGGNIATHQKDHVIHSSMEMPRQSIISISLRAEMDKLIGLYIQISCVTSPLTPQFNVVKNGPRLRRNRMLDAAKSFSLTLYFDLPNIEFGGAVGAPPYPQGWSWCLRLCSNISTVIGCRTTYF